MKNKQSLQEELRAYAESGMYPFHMPGHKRNGKWAEGFSSPFSVDITEIEGFDNLHHAEGILRDAMENAAEIYGAERTWFLVNGSTAGILAAISAAALPGERILMAENSHRSAFHGLALRGLSPVFLPVPLLPEYGIAGRVCPEDVERILSEDAGREERKIRAVYLTSPTYEGVLSDIRRIAEISHSHGIPLLVDEAHGAHLPFGTGFGESAIACGADIAVQSVHKTLPSLTQTAVLHLGRGGEKYFSPETLTRWLKVYESSSPSYILMASIDACIRFMGSGEGKKAMEAYEKNLGALRGRLGELTHIRLFSGEGQDPSKLVLFPDKRTGLTGKGLADLLRSRYYLETEMAARDYLIAMTTLMDTEEGMHRLAEALVEIDAGLCAVSEDGRRAPVQVPAVSENEHAMELARAWNMPKEYVSADRAAGRICGDFVMLYPPGVPMLLPGDRIKKAHAESLLENAKLGLGLEGVRQEKENILLPVLER